MVCLLLCLLQSFVGGFLGINKAMDCQDLFDVFYFGCSVADFVREGEGLSDPIF